MGPTLPAAGRFRPTVRHTPLRRRVDDVLQPEKVGLSPRVLRNVSRRDRTARQQAVVHEGTPERTVSSRADAVESHAVEFVNGDGFQPFHVLGKGPQRDRDGARYSTEPSHFQSGAHEVGVTRITEHEHHGDVGHFQPGSGRHLHGKGVVRARCIRSRALVLLNVSRAARHRSSSTKGLFAAYWHRQDPSSTV